MPKYPAAAFENARAFRRGEQRDCDVLLSDLLPGSIHTDLAAGLLGASQQRPGSKPVRGAAEAQAA
jgi:hypothetical protein